MSLVKLRCTVQVEYEVDARDYVGAEGDREVADFEKNLFLSDPFMIAETLEGENYVVNVEVL